MANFRIRLTSLGSVALAGGMLAGAASAQPINDLNSTINDAMQLGKKASGVSDVSQDITTVNPGTYDCGGHNARISGGNNQITLKHCGIIAILGGENKIMAIAPQALKIFGAHNTVTWTGSVTPVVDNRGTYNTIIHR